MARRYWPHFRISLDADGADSPNCKYIERQLSFLPSCPSYVGFFVRAHSTREIKGSEILSLGTSGYHLGLAKQICHPPTQRPRPQAAGQRHASLVKPLVQEHDQAGTSIS
jgi:hypothetical protein